MTRLIGTRARGYGPVSALALAGFAIVVQACGFAGGSATAEADITTLVTESFVHPDPANCRSLYTEALLEQITGEAGQEALNECEANEADEDNEPAESVAVSELTLGDGEAALTADVKGGEYAGSNFKFTAVETTEGWRLDRVTDVNLSTEAVERSVRQTVAEEELSKPEARCYVDVVRDDVPVALLEQQVLEGGEELQLDGRVEARLLECLAPDRLRVEFVEHVALALEAEGVPSRLADCVLSAAKGLPRRQVVSLASDQSGEAGEAMGRQLMQECLVKLGSRGLS